MRVKNDKGYTLVELLIVIAILAIVGGIIFGFMLTSTQLFSGSKNEVDVQTEAQTTINWLNDMLAEAGYGVTYQEDSAAGLHTLEIYNAENIYTITYVISEGKLYCEESKLESGGTKLVLTSNQLLAEYVTAFSLDTTTLTEENPLAIITLAMDKSGRKVELVRNVTLRNGVAINKTIEEVYEGKAVVVSSVQEVVVYPMESYQAKGSTVQFSARVTGVGFPSQMVTWSIADRTGLKDGTVIDEHTGVLTIDPDEEMGALRVQATSVALDTDGNRVNSGDSSGIVRIMTVTGVQIVNAPTDKQEIGDAFALVALVHGENMDATGSEVYWEIPEQSKKEGLSVNADGVVSLGMGLYNAFPTDEARANATVLVRAISAADPTKYADCVIKLDFPNVDFDFGNLTYLADRNSSLDLLEKLQAIDKSIGDMTLVWSMEDDAGLGGKVSLDTAMGALTVAKDIDYNKEYTLEIKLSVVAPGTREVASVQTIKVVIPKVTISLSANGCEIVKGSSGRLQFAVNGLKTSADEVQVTSIPAVRNTLLYVQGGEVVVSVGDDIANDQFDIKLALKGNASISQTGTIYVLEKEMSDDELAAIINVEDIYLHVPVPGKENRAPSLNEVKFGAAIEYNGYAISYTYDWDRDRCNIKIGTDTTSYYYEEVAGSDVVWYKSNVEGQNFYVPKPGEGDFPSQFASDKATLNWAGDTYTYTRYTYGSDTVYVVESKLVPGKRYQYSYTTQIWADCDKMFDRANGATVTASSGGGGYEAYMVADGDVNTRWGSDYNDDQYIQLDLGSVYTLDRIEINWENARARSYNLMVSADGVTWKTVEVRDIEEPGSSWAQYRVDLGTNNRIDTIPASLFGAGNIQVRYVKMQGVSRYLGYGYSIWEFDVYARGIQP